VHRGVHHKRHPWGSQIGDPKFTDGSATKNAARVDAADTPAVTIEQARALEDSYVERHVTRLEEVGKFWSPLHQEWFLAGSRQQIVTRRDRASRIIEIMKSAEVYERSLLDLLPLDRSAEVEIFTRSFFLRRQTRVVVRAQVVSPLEDLITDRCSKRKLGPRDVERAIAGELRDDDVMYFVGILSTTGWTRDAVAHVPRAPNLTVCLVENTGGTAWRRLGAEGKFWKEAGGLFDPETLQEKLGRTRSFLENHPRLKHRGGFVVISRMQEEIGLSDDLVQRAIDDVCSQDPALEVLDASGERIIKRRRF
jgi:hypothetical protein